MKLTLQSDYSLRVLMHLAVNRETLVTISQIADRYKISKNHLMKVTHQLSLVGLVETVRGRSGGLRLAKEPKYIIIGDVTRHTERHSILVECFPSGAGLCVISSQCRLRSILLEAQEAFFTKLDEVSLADLTDEHLGLSLLLSEVETI